MILHPYDNQKIEIGDTLKIYPDKTYFLSTCAIIKTGNWNIISDRLILYCDKKTLRNKKIG